MATSEPAKSPEAGPRLVTPAIAPIFVGQNRNGTYNVQHYWVTSAGETILLKEAVLTPTYPTSDMGIVAVPWGNYRSYITGGSGKFEGATGYLDYFGTADFHQNTLVLRYRVIEARCATRTS